MGNAYKRFDQELSAATPAVLLTVPAATTAIVKSILVANTGGTASNITVSFAPSGAGTRSIVPLKSLASNDYVDLLAGSNAGPLILEALDTLTVLSSENSVSVVISALLVDRS